MEKERSLNQKKFIEDPIFGELYDMRLNKELYQIQSAEFEDERIFIVRNAEGIICAIMQNEKNEWEADCDLDEKKFFAIMNWIHKNYEIK